MKKYISLIILLFVLSGCGNDSDRYNFSGSSENWDVFYVVNVSNGEAQEKTGTIKFTGDGEGPEIIDYKIETTSGGSEATGIKLDDKVADLGNSMCEGSCQISPHTFSIYLLLTLMTFPDASFTANIVLM